MELNKKEKNHLIESAIVVCSHCIENTLDNKSAGESCKICPVNKILDIHNPPLKKICSFCGAEMKYTTEHYQSFVIHDVKHHIHNIEAYLCPICGLILYPKQESARIEAILKKWDKDDMK